MKIIGFEIAVGGGRIGEVCKDLTNTLYNHTGFIAIRKYQIENNVMYVELLYQNAADLLEFCRKYKRV